MPATKQAVDVTEYIDGEPVHLGTYYIDTWENADDYTLTFTAVDLIGLLGQTTYYGGMYQNVTAGALIASIMDGTDMDYDVDAELATVPLSGHLSIMSRHDALQQVAIAIGATVDDSRGNVIHIRAPLTESSAYITLDRKLMGGGVKLKQLVTAVSVTVHGYSPGAESREALNATLPPGDYEVRFQEPLHSLAITGGAIIEQNVNRAIVRVSSVYLQLPNYSNKQYSR